LKKSVMIWWHFQNYGCALTKALSRRTLNAVSFACSSRGATKLTAKSQPFNPKTRASYFAGSISDAALLRNHQKQYTNTSTSPQPPLARQTASERRKPSATAAQ
jgi:hypothetical protein